MNNMAVPDGDLARVDPFFGPVAPSLRWVPPLRYLLRRERALSLLEQIAPTTLLEAGCGAGALLADLSSRGFECTGLETSPRAIEMARKLGTDLGFRYPIVAQPDRDWGAKFGVVCAFDVLEHIEDEKGALAQWRRWLRPGGNLLLSVPAHSHRWGAGDEWAGHYRRYDRAALLDLLSSLNLQIKHFECYGFPLANFKKLVGARTHRRLLAQRRDDVSLAADTAESGIQRDEYRRRFGAINSVAGRFGLRTGYFLQRLASDTDVGSGYLVMATGR